MSTLAFEFLPAGTARTLFGRLRSAYQSFRDRREQRAAAVTLSGMDDYLLKDIGVSRLNILAAEYGLRTWRS